MIENDNGTVIETDSEYYTIYPYGIYLPNGSKKQIELIWRHTMVISNDYMNDIHYIGNKRIRTQHDSGSHECYNCGHCIDNGHKVCKNYKCYKDRKKRGLCMGEIPKYYQGTWLHEFFTESDFGFDPQIILEKKGVRFKREQCKRCGDSIKWLVDYHQDYHVIEYNKFNKKMYRTSLKQNKRVRGALGELRHLCYVRDNYKCRECGATSEDSKLHIDHILPYSKGGLTELDNLQVLCSDCNHSKYTREWIGGIS